MVILNIRNIVKNLTSFTGKTYELYQSVKIFKFYKKTLIHRYYGPAVISIANNSYCKQYLFYNKYYGLNSKNFNYSQKQFVRDVEKELNKQWLL